MNRSRDIIVGLVFFGLLAVLGVFTIMLSGFRLGGAPTLTVAFENVGGLEVGNEVWIDGVRSGKVRRIRREPGKGRVRVTVECAEDPELFADARITLASASLLGGRVLRIDGGKGPARMDLSALQRGTDTGGALEGAEQEFRRVAEKVESIVSRLDRQLGRRDNVIGLLLNDPESAARLKDALSSLDAVLAGAREDLPAAIAGIRRFTDRLNDERGLLRAITSDEKLKSDVLGAVADLRAELARLRDSKGTLHRLIDDPSLYEEAKAVVADLHRVTAGLSPEHGLGRLLSDDEPWKKLDRALDSVDRAAANLRDATARLSRPDNVLGLLLTDEEMAEKLRRAVASLDDFLETTRENAPLSTFVGILLGGF